MGKLAHFQLCNISASLSGQIGPRIQFGSVIMHVRKTIATSERISEAIYLAAIVSLVVRLFITPFFLTPSHSDGPRTSLTSQHHFQGQIVRNQPFLAKPTKK